MKSLWLAAAFLFFTVPSFAQYSGSCQHEGCAVADGVTDWSGGGGSAEVHCNLAQCGLGAPQFNVTATSWVYVMSCGTSLSFVASTEESWDNGYVTSWTTLTPVDYPSYALASFGIAKDYSGAVVAETNWVHHDFLYCIIGGAS